MCMAPWRAVLPILTLAFLLGGCATASMSLSREELQTIRIERVDVSYSPDAYISWEKAESAYVERVRAAKASAGKAKPWKQTLKEDEEAANSDYQAIMNSPEGKQYMQNMLSGELRKRISASILPKGTRRVVMEVTVVGLSIPGPARRVILGGAPMLGAVTVLKDADTGKELAKLDRMAAAPAGNGVLGVLVDQAFSDLEDRVFNAYLNNVSTWLQATREG